MRRRNPNLDSRLDSLLETMSRLPDEERDELAVLIDRLATASAEAKSVSIAMMGLIARSIRSTGKPQRDRIEGVIDYLYRSSAEGANHASLRSRRPCRGDESSD